MSRNQLQEGISILYDMELNNYLMNRAISKLNYKISQLGRRKTFRKPVRKANNSCISDYFFSFMSFGGIAGAIIGVIYGFFTSEGFFSKIGNALAGIIYFGIIVGCIGAAIGLIAGIIHKSNVQKEIEALYLKDCETQKKRIVDDARRVESEIKEQKFLIQQRDELINRRDEATEKLCKFYSIIDIDPKFRNLIPIGYMNEFISLGISNKLEGADGLYYLIMKELRWDQLQYTMEEISSKLDAVIDTQHSIYNELVHINNQCDIIVNMTTESARTSVANKQLLENVAENTSIAAYNAERISQEIAFQNFMLTY